MPGVLTKWHIIVGLWINNFLIVDCKRNIYIFRKQLNLKWFGKYKVFYMTFGVLMVRKESMFRLHYNHHDH